MKIALIGQKGVPAIYGGVERHVEDLSRELVKKNHAVLVYARKWYTPKNIKKIDGIKIIHTPTIHTKHLDAIVHTFTSTLHAIWQKSNVIHYHGVGPSLLSWMPRILSPKTKVIVTVHCLNRYHQKWNWLAKTILRLGEWSAAIFPHQTITVSRILKKYFSNEFQKETTYIPNGVKIHKKKENTSLIEDKWNLQRDKYLLMVTRLVRGKGIHYLLEAWQFARQLYPKLLQDHKLAIVGGDTFADNYMKELEYIARGDKSTIFTGWQNGQALEELYTNTALLVHPSETEGLPIAVLEAMSYARAVLVSDIPEHKELITDSHYWFSNASIPSLANKIIELIENKENLSCVGEQNKKIVAKNFNWPDIANQTLELYSCPGKRCVDRCYCSA